MPRLRRLVLLATASCACASTQPSVARPPPATPAQLTRELADRVPRALDCFIRELPAHRDIGGRIDVDVTVSEEGRIVDVALVESTVANDQSIRECILDRVRAWRVDRPAAATKVRVLFAWDALPPGDVNPHAGRADKELIRGVIRAHLGEVRACYERGLQRADFAGRVLTRFVIAADGRVLGAAIRDSTLDQPAVERCISDAVHGWRFPPVESGGIVIVDYPFVLKEAGVD